jgi:hypothetical protein
MAFFTSSASFIVPATVADMQNYSSFLSANSRLFNSVQASFPVRLGRFPSTTATMRIRRIDPHLARILARLNEVRQMIRGVRPSQTKPPPLHHGSSKASVSGAGFEICEKWGQAAIFSVPK